MAIHWNYYLETGVWGEIYLLCIRCLCVSAVYECVGTWVFCYSSKCVYLWKGLEGTAMRCADGEQEGEDSSLQAVVCFSGSCM